MSENAGRVGREAILSHAFEPMLVTGTLTVNPYENTEKTKY